MQSVLWKNHIQNQGTTNPEVKEHTHDQFLKKNSIMRMIMWLQGPSNKQEDVQKYMNKLDKWSWATIKKNQKQWCNDKKQFYCQSIQENPSC